MISPIGEIIPAKAGIQAKSFQPTLGSSKS